MWTVVRNLISKSKSINTLLGDVVFITPRESGALAHSFFEWRVKETVDKKDMFVAVAMRPDGYAGAEGSPTNYINFDLETALRLRDNLNDCIGFLSEQQRADNRERGSVSTAIRAKL